MIRDTIHQLLSSFRSKGESWNMKYTPLRQEDWASLVCHKKQSRGKPVLHCES